MIFEFESLKSNFLVCFWSLFCITSMSLYLQQDLILCVREFNVWPTLNSIIPFPFFAVRFNDQTDSWLVSPLDWLLLIKMAASIDRRLQFDCDYESKTHFLLVAQWQLQMLLSAIQVVFIVNRFIMSLIVLATHQTICHVTRPCPSPGCVTLLVIYDWC